jgi:mono/diheme cytochrome c family protein
MFMRLLAPPRPATPTSASPTASGSNATDSAATTTVMVASILPPAIGAASGAATSTPKVSAASITSGQQTFIDIGCAVCHIQNQTMGNVAPLSWKFKYTEQLH